MKKLIVTAVVGLTIGLGGSIAAKVILAKEPATLEESLEAAIHAEAADSGPAHVDSVSVAHADSMVLPAFDSLGVSLAVAETTHVSGHPAAALGLAATAPGAVEGSAATAAAVDASLPEGALTTTELAKLFASMQARDAARVLEQMEDYEVQVILGALNNREAAAILSNLLPERAAVISRAVIRAERSAR